MTSSDELASLREWDVHRSTSREQDTLFRWSALAARPLHSAPFGLGTGTNSASLGHSGDLVSPLIVGRVAFGSIGMRQHREEDASAADSSSESLKQQMASRYLKRDPSDKGDNGVKGPLSLVLFDGKGDKDPGQGFGNKVIKKETKPASPDERAERALRNKLEKEFIKLSEPAKYRAVAYAAGTLPLEEVLPSEALFDILAGERDIESPISIPMEASLYAREDRKRNASVYKSLGLQPNVNDTEDVEENVATILRGKLPGWYVEGNEWFGKGRLVLRSETTHITVTNKKEDLSEAGRRFLDDVDKQVLQGQRPDWRQLRVFFTPQQLKLVPVEQSYAFWSSLGTDDDPSKEEVDVARIVLLGDIVVTIEPTLDELRDLRS